jgi:O-acetylhomoserine (thiol)-lyase
MGPGRSPPRAVSGPAPGHRHAHGTGRPHRLVGSLYGGTHNLFAYTLPRFGIETTFVPARDLDAWRRAIARKRASSSGNRSATLVDVLDIPAISAIAHEQRIPFLVDATVTTPALGRPFEMGADLVVHSATKFLSGHGVVIGGVLVDGGRFDWLASGKFPTLTEPYAGFHGMVFSRSPRRRRSCCARGARVFAISARAWRR